MNKRKEGREALGKKTRKATPHLLDKVDVLELSGRGAGEGEVGESEMIQCVQHDYMKSTFMKTDNGNRISQNENRYMLGCQDHKYYFLHFLDSIFSIMYHIYNTKQKK